MTNHVSLGSRIASNKAGTSCSLTYGDPTIMDENAAAKIKNHM